jgi:dihydroxyacetone kinase-like predicted kinase
MQRFSLEFILYIHSASLQSLQSSLAEFGENIEITEDSLEEAGRNLKVNMVAEDPTLIFDVCSQFGRIKSIKVDEIKS